MLKKVLPASTVLFATLMAFQNSNATPPHPGPDFVLKHGCKNCHMVAGEGSVVAPPLDGIKEHRDIDYIVSKLTDTSAKNSKNAYPVPQDLMSHMNISKVEARFIAEYLMTLPSKNLSVEGHGKLLDEAPPGSHFVPLQKSPSTERGAKIFSQKSCIACHSVGPSGGNLAPNLAGVGARRTRKFIVERITNGAIMLPRPDQESGHYAMPKVKLSSSEIDDLTNWLLTLPPYEVKSKSSSNSSTSSAKSDPGKQSKSAKDLTKSSAR